MVEYNSLELRKFVAPECLFGEDARKMAANYARNMSARKVLLVTDPGVVAVGWTGDVEDELREIKMPYVIYDNVVPNPTSEQVMAGTEVYLAEGCNCIIAVGGGSPMDCAKGIGIVANNERSILEFEGIDEVHVPIPPLICIPTTGGTSAEVSQFAVITDRNRLVKIVIGSKAIVPDVALIDPVTLTSMPADLAANTGMDALTHAFEAYVSPVQSMLTDQLALEGVRMLAMYLRPSILDPQNIELKQKICIACMNAGIAFSNAGVGLVHAMAHSLGGLLDSPHGESNAILLPYVVSFNFSVAADRYRTLGEAMGLDMAGKTSAEVEVAVVDALTGLQESLGIPRTMSGLGVKGSDIGPLAMKAMNDPVVATNPREPSVSDIEEIYGRAL